MLLNYLKIALRNFARHKVYSFINLGGLTVAVTCCLLLGLYVRHEWSYDRFHTKSERLYRAWTQEEYKGDRFSNTVTPFILGPTLKETYPDVEAITRVQTVTINVKKGDGILNERVHMVDPDFLQMFDFPLIQGTVAGSLKELYTAVLSQEMALKYFGTENPIGKTLNMQLDTVMQSYTVTAVAKNTPTNSSIRFGILIPVAHTKGVWSDRTLKSWFSVSPETYVLLRENGTDIPQKLAAQYPSLLKTVLGDEYTGNNYSIHLQPITDIHLNNELAAGNEPIGNPAYSYILSAIALFLLLIACINFMTLSLGQSMSRAREVGVRKAMGAVRYQLMNQFWSESLLMTILAVSLGLCFSIVLLPAFGQLSNQALEFRFDGFTALFILGLIAIVGLIAGSYPALVLSRFRPIVVLKGMVAVKSDTGWFRRSLVVVQFSLSVMLIVGTVILNQQLNYLQDKSLGFRKEQTVIIPVGVGGNQGRQIVERFRNSLANQKDVVSVASSSFPFASGDWGELGYTDYKKVYRKFRFNVVDPYFIPAYNIKLVEGRNFDTKNTADIFGGLIVNQAFVKQYGWKNPLNERLPGNFPDHRIIGIVEDFHYNSLHTKVEPLVMVMRYDSLRRGIENINYSNSMTPDLSIRLSGGELAKKVAMLEKNWKTAAPNEAFSFSFLDQDLQRQYAAEQRLSRIVTIASGLSIIIACLGLFGLATLAVVRRTKEIGVRKVLGSSVIGIVGLLSKDFLLLVIIAILIATPIAWWAMNHWLQDFAYRIEVEWWVFVLAGMLAISIAFLTVSFQSIKAALVNPVKSLKAE